MKVVLQYELQDKMGGKRTTFWKEVEMSSAPTKDLLFNDNDFDFETNRSIIYNLADDSYFVCAVDYNSDYEEMAEMFHSLGWRQS